MLERGGRLKQLVVVAGGGLANEHKDLPLRHACPTERRPNGPENGKGVAVLSYQGPISHTISTGDS
jgi:hypothetical protein